MIPNGGSGMLSQVANQLEQGFSSTGTALGWTAAGFSAPPQPPIRITTRLLEQSLIRTTAAIPSSAPDLREASTANLRAPMMFS